MKRAIVIVDHGSRQEAANQVVVELARLLQGRAGDSAMVRFAHMELCEPTLPEAIEECVRTGALEITIQPLFLVPGRHAAHDIPAIVGRCRAAHPQVTFHLGTIIGADPLMGELLASRVGLL